MEKSCCSHKRHDSGAAPSPVLMDHSTITKLAESAFPEPLYGNVTWQTLLSRPDTLTDSMCAGLTTCPPEGFLALHQHTQAEIYYILSGTGSVEIDGKRHAVSGGSILWIPGDAVHGVFCGPGETLHWLYVFPEARFEDIIYRFQEPIKSKL
ncbi:cupin 2 conserved barrel domain protein [Colletotrichum asianum]|uniref:Cupin 2 conserved barrel domain protein n=1 Tax=Colletotrichum asianum TaxID=702518 RepID=A0A8H3WA00_9PEZI|nr:cupin 2 conserved barrel domain protein [Colletotrichum asianum]